MQLQTADQTRYCFKSHARKRLEERYDLRLDNAAWNQLKSKSSEAKFIGKSNDNPNRVIRALMFHDVMLYFVWDKNYNEIVTFLLPELIKPI